MGLGLSEKEEAGWIVFDFFELFLVFLFPFLGSLSDALRLADELGFLVVLAVFAVFVGGDFCLFEGDCESNLRFDFLPMQLTLLSTDLLSKTFVVFFCAGTCDSMAGAVESLSKMDAFEFCRTGGIVCAVFAVKVLLSVGGSCGVEFELKGLLGVNTEKDDLARAAPSEGRFSR